MTETVNKTLEHLLEGAPTLEPLFLELAQLCEAGAQLNYELEDLRQAFDETEERKRGINERINRIIEIIRTPKKWPKNALFDLNKRETEVLGVLANGSDRTFTPKEVFDFLHPGLDIETSGRSEHSSISVALANMAQRGRVRKVGRGRYRLRLSGEGYRRSQGKAARAKKAARRLKRDKNEQSK